MNVSVSAPFIRRPIATSLLGVAVLLGGALGYWLLPVSARFSRSVARRRRTRRLGPEPAPMRA